MRENILDRKHSKSDHERRVFELFLRDAKLDINPESIESREPPEPDILCATFGGESMAFELTRLCHEEIEKFTGDTVKRGDVAAQSYWLDTFQPIRRILLKKLEKFYDGGYAPHLYLLCYAHNMVTPDDLIIDEIQSILNEKGYGPFSIVWFHGEGKPVKFG